MKNYKFPVTLIPLSYNSKKLIGISHCPGKLSLKSGSSKQLCIDLESLRQQKIDCIVTLVAEIEIKTLGIENFNENVKLLNFIHYVEQIDDLCVPSVDRKENIEELLKNIIYQFKSEKNVLIHCNAGLGRSGTIAALLVKLIGEFSNPIDHIRRYRPGAIETREQEQFVNKFELL